MRCDQLIGLNAWAEDFVSSIRENCTEYTVRLFEDNSVECSEPKEVQISQIQIEPYDKFYGMYENEYSLDKYIFPDGRIFHSYVQAEPWSSGPVIFLALKDENGEIIPESLWDEDEMDSFL